MQSSTTWPSASIPHDGPSTGPRDGEEMIAVIGRGSMIAAILLMFVYTKFVPNDWRGRVRVRAGAGRDPDLCKAPVPAMTTVSPSRMTHAEVFRDGPRGCTRRRSSARTSYSWPSRPILAVYGGAMSRAPCAPSAELPEARKSGASTSTGSSPSWLGGHGGRLLSPSIGWMKRPCALEEDPARQWRAVIRTTLARFEREVSKCDVRAPRTRNTIEIYDFGRTDATARSTT